MAVKTNADARHGSVLDDDDSLSDTSSILTEIGSQDFPRYFFEHDNRLFPSYRLFPSHGEPYPSYPFPVDGPEQNVRVFWLPPSPSPVSTYAPVLPSGLHTRLRFVDQIAVDLMGCI